MRRTTGFAATLVAALVFAAVAVAGTFDPAPGDKEIGKAGDFRYEKDSEHFDPGNSNFASSAIFCGLNRQAIGGGAKLEGPATSKFLAVTRPLDVIEAAGGDPDNELDDAWDASGFGPDMDKFTTYGICRKGDGLEYVLKDVADDATGLRSARVSCDQGLHVVSGGAIIATTESWINSSRPFDSSDNGTRRDDGWAVKVLDTIGGIGGFQITAVCSDENPSYEKGSAKNVPAGDGASAVAECPSGTHVVGGGVEVDGPPNRARATGTYPKDDGDVDDVPDDAWKSSAYNLSGLEKDIKTYAICIG
jgi:hypothetical protein